MSTNSSKKSFRLIYWGGIPGRGEFIRLTFEYAGYPYTELNSPKSIVELLSNPQNSGHPTHFAPPILELPDGDYISQTANILNYVAPKLGLAGVKGSSMMMARTEAEHEEAEVERAKINQIVSTALDFTNESHDVHHPIAVSLVGSGTEIGDAYPSHRWGYITKIKCQNLNVEQRTSSKSASQNSSTTSIPW